MEVGVNEKVDKLKNSYDYREIGESNSKIKQVKSLIANKKPNPKKQFIAEGIWINGLNLLNGVKIVDVIVCLELIKSNQMMTLIENILNKNNPNLYFVSKKTFLKISERDNPDGVISIAEFPKYELYELNIKKRSIILILDGLEIPGNIGTILRLSDGVQVDAVFICNRKTRLTHPKILKGSQGACLSIPIFEIEDRESIYEWLKNNKYDVFLTDTRAENNYYDQNYGDRVAFILGSERYGIDREWYNFDYQMVKIPMMGNCDSLNVAVAATVLIYDVCVKLKMI